MPQTQIQALPLRRPTGLVARIVLALKQTSARRRDRRHLAQLDPRLLRDIGLDTHMAADECAKPFWRR